MKKTMLLMAAVLALPTLLTAQTRYEKTYSDSKQL